MYNSTITIATPETLDTDATGRLAAGPTVPSVTGYHWDDVWFDELGQQYSLPYTFGSNMTLNLKWQVNMYTVTFDANGGTAVTAHPKVEHGGVATKPNPSPTKGDIEFLGWALEGQTQIYDFATPVTGNITLVAQWNESDVGDPPVAYMVNFDANGGTFKTGEDAIQKEVAQNSIVEPPETPTKDGCDFVEWRLEGEDKGYNFSTPVTGNIKLVAQWNTSSTTDSSTTDSPSSAANFSAPVENQSAAAPIGNGSTYEDSQDPSEWEQYPTNPAGNDPPAAQAPASGSTSEDESNREDIINDTRKEEDALPPENNDAPASGPDPDDPDSADTSEENGATQPGKTGESAASGQPESAEGTTTPAQPEATEEPAASAQPEATEEPAASAQPEVTEEPAAPAQPEATEETSAPDQTDVQEEPAASAQPEVTEEPTTSAQPEATEEPAASAQPEVTEEPAAPAQPEATEEPVASAQPEATEEPAAPDQSEGKEEPAAPAQPETTEETTPAQPEVTE